MSDAAMVDYPLSAATADRTPVMENMLARARAFAEPLIADEKLDTGENSLAHADAVAAIVAKMGGSEAMQAASYLVYSCQHLNRPQEVIAKVFGDNFAALAVETTKAEAEQTGAATEIEQGEPALRIAAEHTHIVRQLRQVIQCVPRILRVHVIQKIQIEQILPGLAPQRPRLDLGQAEIAQGERAQGAKQRTGAIARAEHQRGLPNCVRPGFHRMASRICGPAQQKEPGEILSVAFDGAP